VRKNSYCYPFALFQTWGLHLRTITSMLRLKAWLELCYTSVAGTATVRPCATTPWFALACRSVHVCAASAQGRVRHSLLESTSRLDSRLTAARCATP